jgi:hypothetical protein
MSEVWIWLMGLVMAITFFAMVETYAIRYPTNQWTLSHCIAWLGVNFPLSIWICGVFAGAMAVHFFWPYCPFGASSG